MLISRQQGIKRIADILTASGLFTPDEIRMVFDYFEWNSDEALKLGHRDLDGVKKELLAEQLWFVRNEMAPTAVRAGNLYFALGVVDADNCLPDVCWVNKAAASTPVKMVATFVYNMSMEYAEKIREPHLRMLMNIARNDPEIIKEAYESQKDVKKDEPDNIILLTVYFLLKYPQVNPQDQTEDFAEFLKQQKCSKKETQQELALMQQYEELLIQNFSKIYGTFADEKKPSRQALDEIERAFREGKVDDRIRKLALTDTSNKRRSTYLDELWKYAIGLAFINFSLSARLKDVASVCIAANPDEMLFVINSIDMRGDFRDRGGNFDKIFCIDAPTLINCAVAVCNENILKEQFGRNREIYLNCMETKNLESYFFMSQVTGQVDAAFHKEREQLELARQQKRLMDVFTSAMDVPKREEMKKYLSGETDVKALYSLVEKIRPGVDLVWPWNCMGHYRKGYGYDTLCKRCEAAMMVCGGFDLYCRDYLFDCNYMYEEVVVDKDRMKELFRSMEEEQLTLSSQLSGFLQISDAVQYEKKVLKAFTDAGKEIFGAYLEKQPDKMLEAFRGAEVPGRIFGLQVLAGNKKLPADIICSFAQDKSKEVREALVDILGKAKGYEKNVREMLASQKVTEREVAIKVLAKWAGKQSGEKYVPILKETLEKETSTKIRTLLAGVIPMDIQEPAKEDKNSAIEGKKPVKEGKKQTEADRKPAKEDKKTVPDFGFDDKMRRLFDYGKRKFYVTITTAFETEVFDETGKKLKKLPAPGKQDDEEKAAVAYEEFKLLKKQIKEAASSQKIRLETALSDGREWSMEVWENLFVKNPIMHPFAIGLIWGIYEDGKLLSSFRYMEDGSFNTEDGEEIYPMDEDSRKENIPQKVIKIVHPLELPDETWKAWSEQLEDYEIIQPILQLDRPIYCMEEEEAKQKKLDRFDGWKVDFDIFIKRLTKLGWRNTWYEDYGEYIYSKENDELSMRVDLAFKFHYRNGSATIYDAQFFKTEGDETPDDEDACLLKCVPERHFSEIVMQLDSAAEDA